MPATIDELRTVLSVAGQANYVGSMMSAAAATEHLARRTRQSYSEMNDAARVYFDETAQRWRDLDTGQFAKLQGQGWGGPIAAATAALTILAAEIAVLSQVLRITARAFMEATRTGAEFEDLMKFVEIQSGATADQMEQIKAAALSDEMVDLGVGAIKAAEAFKVLAAMGYSVEEQQQAMVTITQTAVATGGDLEQMTYSLLAVMKQYGYTIADLPTVANAFAAALNNTKFQAADLMLAMKYGGPIARNLGWSIGETVAVLNELYATLGNAEMTGTGFRGVLNALLAPSNETAAAFKEAGLSIDDLGKHSSSAGELLRWLRSGTWETSTIMRAFGAEAGTAAAVLLDADVPALEAMARAIDTTGNVARDAQNKVSSLKGEAAQLAAGFERLKVKVYEASKVFSSDFVQGVALAQKALTEYIDMALKRTREHDRAIGDSRDLQLEVAEAVIIAGARVAVILIQVSRALAMQGVYVLGAVRAWTLLKLAFLEYWYVAAMMTGQSDMAQGIADSIDNTKRGLRELGSATRAMWQWALQGGAQAIEQVNALERDLLSRVHTIQGLAGVKLRVDRTTDSSVNAAPPLPLPDSADPEEVLKEEGKLLQQKRAALAAIAAQQRAMTTDPVREAQLELALRQAELTLAREHEATVLRLTKDEGKRRDARLQTLEAEAQAMGARKALQKELDDQNEAARKKSASEAERAAEKWKRQQREIDKAAQAVIGGRLSEAVREQIDRLSGISMRNDRNLFRAVTRRTNDQIVITLQSRGGLSPEQKDQVIDLIVPAIQQVGQGARA